MATTAKNCGSAMPRTTPARTRDRVLSSCAIHLCETLPVLFLYDDQTQPYRTVLAGCAAALNMMRQKPTPRVSTGIQSWFALASLAVWNRRLTRVVQSLHGLRQQRCTPTSPSPPPTRRDGCRPRNFDAPPEVPQPGAKGHLRQCHRFNQRTATVRHSPQSWRFGITTVCHQRRCTPTPKRRNR